MWLSKWGLCFNGVKSFCSDFPADGGHRPGRIITATVRRTFIPVIILSHSQENSCVLLSPVVFVEFLSNLVHIIATDIQAWDTTKKNKSWAGCYETKILFHLNNEMFLMLIWWYNWRKIFILSCWTSHQWDNNNNSDKKWHFHTGRAASELLTLASKFWCAGIQLERNGQDRLFVLNVCKGPKSRVAYPDFDKVPQRPREVRFKTSNRKHTDRSVPMVFLSFHVCVSFVVQSKLWPVFLKLVEDWFNKNGNTEA